MLSSYKNIFYLGLYQLYRKNSHLLNNKEKEPIHIIGNGWATYHFVKNLDKNKFIPIIISPNEYILNTPKLISQLDKPNDKKINIKNVNGILIKDKIIDIEPKNKVIISLNHQYRYKNLVIAIGSEINDFGVKGVNEYTLKIKNSEDIDLLRKELSKINFYTEKKIYVIGGGPTGVELVSRLKALGYNPTLLEGMRNILNGFDNLTQKTIYNHLVQNQKINIKLNESVKEINNLTISTSNGENYEYDLAIWVGGVKFNGYKKTKLYEKLKELSIIVPRGISVRDDFSIGESIYCIGDIVSNKGPPTAQNAKFQARWLAEYFNSNKKTDNKYEVKELGKIIHLDDKLYLESKIYKGFLCKCVEKIVEYIYKV